MKTIRSLTAPAEINDVTINRVAGGWQNWLVMPLDHRQAAWFTDDNEAYAFAEDLAEQSHGRIIERWE
jgi:hypothetical protein